MLYNYLLTSIRHLRSQPAYTCINIVGLSIGIASVIVIGTFVQAHFNFDGNHEKADRIHRVLMEAETPDAGRHVSRRTDGPLAATLRSEYPEVEDAIRFRLHDLWVTADEQAFETRAITAGPAFFDLFDFKSLDGDPGRALEEPNSVLITKSLVPILFPEGDALGESITLNGPSTNGIYTVTGILEDVENSSIRFNIVVSASPQDTETDSWMNTWLPGAQYRPFQTWLLLREGASHKALETKVQDVIERYLGPDDAKVHTYHLQPLNRMHLYSARDYNNSVDHIGRVYTFGFVAILIATIACINYVNLTTARASRRAREIGLRKVVGAHRRQLVAQLLGESFMTTLLALFVGVLIALIYFPTFKNIIRWNTIDINFGLIEVTCLTGLTIGIALLSGLYPAWHLTRVSPATIVKGDDAFVSRRSWARRALVITQFTVSIVMVIGTLTVRDQVQWAVDRDQGYDWHNVIEVPILWVSRTLGGGKEESLNYRYDTVQQAFLEHADILDAAATRFPQGAYISQALHKVEGSAEDWNLGIQDTDERFFDFFGIEMLAGRVYANRSETLPSGETIRIGTQREEYVLNAKAVELLGWKTDNPNPYQNAIGKGIGAQGHPQGTVVGVCADYHVRSLHAPIGAVAYNLNPGGLKFVQLRLKNGDTAGALAHAKQVWNAFLPSRPFEYTSVDETVSYWNVADERRLASVLDIAAALSIFVSSLGLLGLVSYIVEARMREVGIRKILGAGWTSIFRHLTSDFALLILAANVIACPLAWFWADNWLNTFIYRMDLGVSPFLLTASLSFSAAALMISYHVHRAASLDPVETIRR
jgi:putative ABC transport system permease protein